MDVTRIDIHELLPQREPFVMVGSLVSFDMQRIVTATVVSEANLFVDAGLFAPAGLIENMAQTCAARIGYVNKYILHKSVRIGFIGAIRSFRLYRLPAIGETLETTVDTLEEVFGLTLVRATIRVGTEIIAEGEMKIAENEEPLPVSVKPDGQGKPV
ncbi:MAG: pseudouridylate synthase [Bacteroides sp.]|nr:pseudouridylate synthase [Bacteroides sp.]MCM1448304.1 pseudouridylate synthase [Bacteroides sp.]